MKMKSALIYAIFWTILQINQAFGSTAPRSKGIYYFIIFPKIRIVARLYSEMLRLEKSLNLKISKNL
jgi:hypothetical protein